MTSQTIEGINGKEGMEMTREGEEHL